MTIPFKEAKKIYEELQSNKIKHLFAQSDALHILKEVNESPENFPDFDKKLEDKITFASYLLLSVSCSMLESQAKDGINGLEIAATLLNNTYGIRANSKEQNFHILVASMAYYVAGQYSRAFVSIRKVESTTGIAGIITALIRKDFTDLIRQLNEVLLAETPIFEDQRALDEWVITITVSRSIASILEYLFTGESNFLDYADQILQEASLISSTSLLPAYWWIVRLLRLMHHNLKDSSLWKNLPLFFDLDAGIQLDRYIRLMAFSKPPVIELWISQRSALSLALNPDNRGGIINLRTSAGKTRIAELAILQTLGSNPSAKIIYLAPFRSLAFEVEQTLVKSCSWLGFHVSHLYGGLQVSAADTDLMSESNIIIATPEKVRALFRAAPELFENVKLIIIDEGHLIGPSARNIRNELFIDHLRAFAKISEARILLLSAVLPNTKELAEWVTEDQKAVAISSWKPSAERFGLLRWNGKRVRIDWQGEIESFNPSFVKSTSLGFGRRKNHFPNNKIEAIAATAVRLVSIGPVMIFTGKANSVPTLAKSVLLALGEDPTPHHWPQHEWKVFEAVCSEELQADSIEIKAARVGVICHSNRLTPQVRMAIEYLMRSCPPKIIIATTTLGQGVNIGISSVIVATPYIGIDPITKSDFWNICGRAGRAFIDGEGKILYAIDDVITKKRTSWHIKKDEALAKQYFDLSSIDRVESGLLFLINSLRKIAKNASVSFDVLIELVANNEFEIFGNKQQEFKINLDLLDDGLLALHEDKSINTHEDSVEWTDHFFCNSLAAIQARTGISQSTTDDVIRFLKARTKFTLARIPNKGARKGVVSSGLPLSVAIKAHDTLDYFRILADGYLLSDKSPTFLNNAVRQIEVWARENGSSITAQMPEESQLDEIRDLWLRGIGLQKIIENNPRADAICKDLYGYQLPWILHGISQKMDKMVEKNRANALTQIALIVEIGVPSELAAWIFLAGIRSRAASTELSQTGIQFGSSIAQISKNLRDPEFIKPLLPLISPPTTEWLNLLAANESHIRMVIPRFEPFKLKNSVDTNILHVRNFHGKVFLCTFDGRVKIQVESSDQFPFYQVIDDARFFFEQVEGVWLLRARDPRYEDI